MHRWFNNPEATRTLMEQREGFSLEQAEAWVRRAMDDSGEDRKYAIVVEGYDEPVGFTALYGLFRQTAPELGALIGDDVRGKGVGRRAEALTIAKAFDEFGAHRVYGRIPACNEVAKRTVAEPRLAARGDDARPPAPRRRAPDDCEVWGVLPDEFRAAGGRRTSASSERSRQAAELIADRGEAAASEEFFRSRPFLDAEGVTHTLRIEAGEAELLAPLIVRAIGAGPESSTRSPPTATRARHRVDVVAAMASQVAAAIDPRVDFSATGLVRAFIRHTLGEPPLAGATRAQRRPDRRPGAAAEEPDERPPADQQEPRSGYEVRLVPGPETTPGERAGFLAAYEQTMRRTGAAERYFFGAPYFDRILESSRTWLALALAPGGDVAAASIAVHSDGFLHYYLSGSADAHLRDSPMKNVVASLVELADRAGPAAQPRRRHRPRRPPRGVQARLRQPRAALAHLGAGLRPGRLRRASAPPSRDPGRLLPRPTEPGA